MTIGLKKAEAKVPFKRLNKPIDVAKILAFCVLMSLVL
jgi:hypothetical protein